MNMPSLESSAIIGFVAFCVGTFILHLRWLVQRIDDRFADERRWLDRAIMKPLNSYSAEVASWLDVDRTSIGDLRRELGELHTIADAGFTNGLHPSVKDLLSKRIEDVSDRLQGVLNQQTAEFEAVCKRLTALDSEVRRIRCEGADFHKRLASACVDSVGPGHFGGTMVIDDDGEA